MTHTRRIRPFGFPTLMDELFKNELQGSYSNKETVPAVNIVEVKNGYELELAAPGFKKEDINLEVNNDTLTISSERKEEKKEEDKKNKYTRREFSFAKFRRSFSLPEDVDQNNISAKYDSGILQVSIPQKKEVEQKVKQIEIG
ncbi:MAG: hypothetical protein CL840_09750 [Crocinitomicaceae bacterium]|nr:hypothetical protein [Crocinitomicaceae bacterium]|tara:strand:- start:6384 stop:6812 length:429 start_codon:yes stop_codon:yes gene_type:complete